MFRDAFITIVGIVVGVCLLLKHFKVKFKGSTYQCNNCPETGTSFRWAIKHGWGYHHMVKRVAPAEIPQSKP